MASLAVPAIPQGQDEAGAVGVDHILNQVSQDDQDEWEYEYSTTETETYYLTLELSYPEFKDAPAKAHYHSRGGYYKNWLDQNEDRPDAGPVGYDLEPDDDQSEAEVGNDIGNDDGDDERIAEPIPQLEDELMPDIDPLLRPSSNMVDNIPNETIGQRKVDKGKQREGEPPQERVVQENEQESKKESKRPMEDIQILELHSRNPIISYRGHVYEGSWAEVIGTEAILADREGSDYRSLPVLRELPGGVDILGASSSRILTKEVILKPKAPKEDSLAAIRKEWNIRIPPGKDRTGERAEQIRFLENLMALKKMKGQTDDVTVYAIDGEGKDFDDRKDPDFKPRKRKPTIRNDNGEQSNRRERRHSRRSISQRNARIRGLSSSRVSSAGGIGRSPIMGSSALSTPTPSHWDDLSGNGYAGEYEDENDDHLPDVSEQSEGRGDEANLEEFEDEDDDE